MATRLLIDGGWPLRGEVAVSAAKNAGLPALRAALVTSEPVVLDKIPGQAPGARTRRIQ
jgi:UDP-N-acetylglucosamine 1-carboxyvinyltransferase